MNNSYNFSIEDIRKAIDKSGYVFELQLCPIFEKFGFITYSCAQFQDQDTGKSRELDIEAVDDVMINDIDDVTLITDRLSVRVVAECKNNSSPLILFTRQPYLGHYAEPLICGNPEFLKDVEGIPSGGLFYITDYLKFEEFHHNWKFTHPAYQFGLMKPKFISKGTHNEVVDWSITHDDYYESINKLTKACFSKGIDAYKKSQHFIINEIYLELIYPILILSGDIYECRVEQESYSLNKIERTILQWETKSASIKHFFNIDIVTGAYLQNYLELIKKEVAEIKKRIVSDLQFIKNSVLKDGQTILINA